MDKTNEYEQGWGALAKHYHLKEYRHQQFAEYIFPGTWENGWIRELHACEGLFAASAWFQYDKKIEYTIRTSRHFLLVFCIDQGTITITQQGKAARKLTPFTQLVIGNGKPLRITIPAGEHVCFTSVMIFNSCISSFLTNNKISYPILLDDAKEWMPRHIDTPNIMLVMEQIRWGVRGNRLPLPAYLCKAMELLYLFAHNRDMELHKRNRRHYVTWENEQKLYRVKERIDANPLPMPSTEELCILAEMSESKLRISFKSLYGQTLYHYKREAVMKRAMQLLADDELNIKNIAVRCGYENAAKFSAAFQDVHGITPSAFRKTFDL